MEFGFLGGKDFAGFGEKFNLLAYKDYGPKNTAMGFIYRNQLKYQWKSWIEPGFEIYGDTKGKDRFQDQQLSIGPALFGKIHTLPGQGIGYEVGWLVGATPATADHTMRWKLEYEFAF